MDTDPHLPRGTRGIILGALPQSLAPVIFQDREPGFESCLCHFQAPNRDSLSVAVMLGPLHLHLCIPSPTPRAMVETLILQLGPPVVTPGCASLSHEEWSRPKEEV